MKQKEKKEAKYNSELLPQGSCPLVIPLVFDHFGRWGKQSVRYLNKLTKSARDGKEDEMRLTSRTSGDQLLMAHKLNQFNSANMLSKLMKRQTDRLTDR